MTVFYRELRVAGLVTRGGRGRSAPTSSRLDASRLVLSLLASDMAKNAVPAVLRFGALKPCPSLPSSSEYPGFDQAYLVGLDLEVAIEYLAQFAKRPD